MKEPKLSNYKSLDEWIKWYDSNWPYTSLSEDIKYAFLKILVKKQTK